MFAWPNPPLRGRPERAGKPQRRWRRKLGPGSAMHDALAASFDGGAVLTGSSGNPPAAPQWLIVLINVHRGRLVFFVDAVVVMMDEAKPAD